MEYQLIVEKAKSNLKDYSEIIIAIKDCIISGSTSGEIISRLGHYLKNLRDINNEAYSLLEKDITQYLEACGNNGYLIR